MRKKMILTASVVAVLGAGFTSSTSAGAPADGDEPEFTAAQVFPGEPLRLEGSNGRDRLNVGQARGFFFIRANRPIRVAGDCRNLTPRKVRCRIGDTRDIIARLRDGNDRIEISQRIIFDTGIRTGRGKDEARGGSGTDFLFGDRSNDRLLGRAGGDVLKGEQGNDTLKGGRGEDVVNGGPGRDRVRGGPGRDTVRQF